MSNENQSKYNCLLIDEKDNVVTALSSIKKGENAIFIKAGNSISIKVNNDIPFGHKLSLMDINKGEHIIKYGESIGGATANIKKGDYVHVHNLESLRARGDKNL